MDRIVPRKLDRPLLSPGPRWPVILGLGAAAFLLFVSLSSMRLAAQGLYYDELHQATAAFVYTGNFEYPKTDGLMFARTRLYGLPVLNMSYSGALKTALYGLYLRFFDASFSVVSWRLLGILLVASGIVFVALLAGGSLPVVWLISFLLLILTDLTVLLTSRHDWGPTALALFLRLLFIGIWIHGETRERTPASNSFLLGALVGIAVFEKLSSVVLVLPLLIIFLFSPIRRRMSHVLACIAGGILGGIPLILVNLSTFVKYGFLISLESVAAHHTVSLHKFMTYIPDYLSLGAGTIAQRFILGTDSAINGYIEGVLMAALLAGTAYAAVRHWGESPLFRLSGVMLLSYLGAGISLFFLPAPTWVHHWTIGTPFQYAAVSLALAGFSDAEPQASSPDRLSRPVLLSLIVLLILPRLFGLASTERALLRGQAGSEWDPSLTKIGLFAARHADDAVFIASDWGMGTQIFCLSNGRPDLVHELFWNYRGPDEMKKVLRESGKRIMYLVDKKPHTKVNPANTARMLHDIDMLTDWKETAVDKEAANLKAVEVRKLLYAAQDVTGDE